MFVPKFCKIEDFSVLTNLVQENPLGSWSAIADGEIIVNHIPFILYKTRGEFGTLAGHVSRANNIWSTFSKNQNSVVVFHGEQSYISPSWYPSKYKEGKAVPTWNYAVVQAHGMPAEIEDPEWLIQHVNDLTDLHEGGQARPWRVDDAPSDFIDKLIKSIVGIEIPITKLTGKWKLGQNRSEADQFGMVAGLMSCGDKRSQALGELTKKYFDSSGD